MTRLQIITSDIGKVGQALSLAAALPRFLRERVTLGQAEDAVRRLLDSRAERFLELARADIFGNAVSPYLPLLAHAGCSYADLRAHVLRDGLEPTLTALAAAGVYLTSDEFKGKSDVVRGNTRMRVSPGSFQRRGRWVGYTIQSSGSRNLPVNSFVPLDWRGLQALGEAFFYSAHDLFSYRHAVFESVVAGRISAVLINSRLGVPTDRWFALKVGAYGAVEDRYHRDSARIVAALGRQFGAGIASPEVVERGDFGPIERWIAENRRLGRKSCIRTVASNAAAIARSAISSGFSLHDTMFLASGEPVTEPKKHLVESAGGRLAVRYGPGGGICAALGCGHPTDLDEMHVPQTAWTCIQHPLALDEGGPPVHPLLLTTLHAWAPRLLLNVANGDYATLTTRNCGCPLEAVGFTQHIHTVRSFEKVTSEGMNYFGADLLDVLEQALPAEFGGGPGHYQLVEEEGADGQTRLTLVVHPDAGPIDEQRILARLQERMAAGSRNHRFMAAVWRDARTLRIRREPPRTSVRGKVVPLHIDR